jgi:hypothetical protein
VCSETSVYFAKYSSNHVISNNTEQCGWVL